MPSSPRASTSIPRSSKYSTSSTLLYLESKTFNKKNKQQNQHTLQLTLQQSEVLTVPWRSTSPVRSCPSLRGSTSALSTASMGSNFRSVLGYIHRCGDVDDEVCHLYLTTHINARPFFALPFDQDGYDYFCEPLQIQLML